MALRFLLPLFLTLLLSVSTPVSSPNITTSDEALNRALIEAIEQHDRQKVLELLNRGASVDAKGVNLTALQTAIFYAELDIVKLLLRRGAKIKDQDLAEAARGVQGDNDKSTAIVKLLLASGANLRTGGVDALAEAARANNLDLVALFLGKGVNPNGQTKSGTSVLFEIADADSFEAIQSLLAAGANARVIDKEKGQTVLMKAAQVRAGNEPAVRGRILKLLLSHGANIQAKDNNGLTALMYSVQQYLSEAGGVLSHAEIVRLLLDAGAEVNARSKRGDTALLIAVPVWQSPSDIPQLLVEKGADVNLANDAGQTALMLAADDGSDVLLRFLLSKGAKIDVADKDNRTAIAYAVESGHPESVALLANSGASLAGLPYKSEDELRVATHNFGLIRAVRYHHVEEIKKFLAAGADPNFRGPGGRTALIIDAQTAYSNDVINLLLDSKANVDAADDDGNTAVMLAGQSNRDEIVKLLLEHNAAVDVRNKDQKTALSLAAAEGNKRVAEMLIAKGADVNVRDAKGMTPLLLASDNYYAQEELVKLLLAKGADANATDPQENTSLMLAARAGAFQIIEVLIAGGANVNARNKDGWSALRHLKETHETWTKDETAPQRRALIMAPLKKAGAKED